MNRPRPSTRRRTATIGELQEQYRNLFGYTTRSRNRSWLQKRIAWRQQALAQGDLSDRARQRAAELLPQAELRLAPPAPLRMPTASPVVCEVPARWDDRLPPPGTRLTRTYKGEPMTVTILSHGFEFAGERYRSLSAVAKAITGSHVNGYAFFGLTRSGASV